MIIRDSNGQLTPNWHNRFSRLGPYHKARQLYAGREGRPAHYAFHPEMAPYTDEPFQMAGMIWTISPIPHPVFVGRFADGTLAAMSIGDAFEGWSTLPDAIARSRAARTMERNVIPFPPSAGSFDC